MTKWNTHALGETRYPEGVTEQQRQDILAVVLAMSGIAPMSVDDLDVISARQTATPDEAAAWGTAAIAFTFACWRVMGDEQSGMIDLGNWIPVLDRVSVAVHGTDAKDASGSCTNELFAALVMAARNPRNAPEVPSIAPESLSDAVTSAILLSGSALQFAAARHPHAPRIKPGSMKMPPKVNSLASDLAHAVDTHLANS